MDGFGLLAIALLLIALGVGTVLAVGSRNGLGFAPSSRSFRLDRPRPTRPRPAPAEDEPLVVDAVPVGDREERAQAEPVAVAGRRPLEALPDGWREEMRRAVAEQDGRLARLDERLVDLSHQVERRLDDVVRDIRSGRDAAAGRQAAVDARQEAAIERLRADLHAQLGERTAPPPTRLNERRLEVTADLYARVARLESAVAAVTNPILLSGETYAPPAEFAAEAFSWENWKEVGERAFAMADAYSAQRLYLSEATRDDLAAFVSTLRDLLTRSVYPNLRADPDPDQLATLRGALDALAAELPRVRGGLEREFRRLGGADQSRTNEA